MPELFVFQEGNVNERRRPPPIKPNPRIRGKYIMPLCGKGPFFAVLAGLALGLVFAFVGMRDCGLASLL